MNKNNPTASPQPAANRGEDTNLLATPQQVAELLQVSTRSLWRMRKAGKLPNPIRLGASVRWRRDEIEQWVRDGCPAVARRDDTGRSR